MDWLKVTHGSALSMRLPGTFSPLSKIDRLTQLKRKKKEKYFRNAVVWSFVHCLTVPYMTSLYFSIYRGNLPHISSLILYQKKSANNTYISQTGAKL